MEIIINAIMEMLCSRRTGILKKKDISNFRNLQIVLTVLDDRNKPVFSYEEKRFIQEVNESLEKRDFNRAERLYPPHSLKSFHEALLKVLPFLKEVDIRMYH